MASSLSLFFAALIAVSQAAARPQFGNTASQQTATSTGSASVSSSTSNTGPSGASSSSSGMSSGTADFPGSITLIIPPQLINSFFSSAKAVGTPNGSNSADNALAAIISAVTNFINNEQQQFGSAVKDLVKDNVDLITETIDMAAYAGGRFLSDGVRILGTLPTLFGQVIG